MSKIWDIQMQIVTPSDVTLMELEEKLDDMLTDEELESNYIIATELDDDLENEDEEE